MYVNNVKSKTEYVAQFRPFLLLSLHFFESSEISDIILPLYFLSTTHLSPENSRKYVNYAMTELMHIKHYYYT